MRKREWILGGLTLLLAIFCVIFWQKKEAEQEKLELLCQNSAAMALEDFKNYQKHGAEADYISGVAQFQSFMKAYLLLNDSAVDAEYTWCNMLYGEMLLRPEKVQGDIQGMIGALEYLAKDYEDPNGYIQINAYTNTLRHEKS